MIAGELARDATRLRPLSSICGSLAVWATLLIGVPAWLSPAFSKETASGPVPPVPLPALSPEVVPAVSSDIPLVFVPWVLPAVLAVPDVSVAVLPVVVPAVLPDVLPVDEPSALVASVVPAVWLALSPVVLVVVVPFVTVPALVESAGSLLEDESHALAKRAIAKMAATE